MTTLYVLLASYYIAVLFPTPNACEEAKKAFSEVRAALVCVHGGSKLQ